MYFYLGKLSNLFLLHSVIKSNKFSKWNHAPVATFTTLDYKFETNKSFFFREKCSISLCAFHSDCLEEKKNSSRPLFFYCFILTFIRRNLQMCVKLIFYPNHRSKKVYKRKYYEQFWVLLNFPDSLRRLESYEYFCIDYCRRGLNNNLVHFLIRK